MKDNIFSPQSIAVIGVSEDPNKISSVIFKNILEGGYKGKVYPINPKYEKIKDVKCFPSILDIKDKIDQVCIAIPAQFVEDIVDQCIAKKVNSIVIVTAGFKETGIQGKAIEERISEKVKKAGIRLLGPNCLGYINNNIDLNVSFAREKPSKGNISLVSQSGAFCTAILDMGLKEDIGFSQVVSIGNKPDIFENELVQYLEKDKNTNAIAIYLEEFTDGKDFVEISKKISKPIIIITPGSSTKAQQAISSHTGSMVSSYDTTIAAIKKANIIRTNNTEEMFDMIKLFSYGRIPNGKNIIVVTNAGGPGIISADFSEKYNLNLVDPSEDLKNDLKKILPEATSVKNPIDILGDADAQRYGDTIKIVSKYKEVDSIIVLLTPQLITEIEGTAQLIVDIQKESNIPIIPCFLGGKDISKANEIFDKNNLFYTNNIESCIKDIHLASEYKENKKDISNRNIKEIVKRGKYTKDILDIVDNNIEVLDDRIVEGILKEFKITIPQQLITSNYQEALEFAAKHFPVVIKATSKDLAHKTDFKGIYLDIRTISEFEDRYKDLEENIEKATGRKNPNILIQEMIEPKAEIFVGANRQGDMHIYENKGLGFGHLLAVGQGGIYTEVYKDIQHILVPETIRNIEKSINNTKISKILDGYRGKSKLEKDKLIEMIDRIQSMLVSYPQVVSLDINPIIVTEDRVVAVDVKMYIKD